MLELSEAPQSLALAVIEQAIEDLGSSEVEVARDAEDFLFKRLWDTDCVWSNFFDLNRGTVIPALTKLKVKLEERRVRRERVKVRNRLEREAEAQAPEVG